MGSLRQQLMSIGLYTLCFSVLSVNGHPIDGDIFATNGIIHVMTTVLASNRNQAGSENLIG